MKKKSISVVLVGGILAAGGITLLSCRSEQDGREARKPPGAEIKERKSAEDPQSSVESILRARPAKGQLNHDDRAALNRQIASLSTEDLRDLLENTSENRNTPEFRALFGMAIAEYAKRSPDDVLSWFKPEAMKTGEAGFFEVSQVLAKSSPEVLRTWIRDELSKGNIDAQNSCFVAALTCLSSVDAKSAFAFAMSREWACPTYEIVNAVFGDFGGQDPVEAERAANAALRGRDREIAMHNIAISMAEADPAGGIALAKKQSNLSTRGTTIASIISTLMDSDKAGAVEKLKALDDSELQTTLQAFAGSFASVVTKLGASDPDQLAAIMERVVPSAANDAVFEAAISSLGEKHADKAMELIESLPHSEMKTRLFGSHIGSLARSNPEVALETASRLSEPALRASAFKNIGEAAGAKGWEETSKILGGLSEADRIPFVLAASPFLSGGNPKEFAGLVGDGTIKIEGGARNEILSQLGQNLSNSDPTFAKDWLGGLPSTDQPAAMQGIADAMAQGDINQLGSMLQNMPRDKAWEEGVKVLIKNTRKSDPEMAGRWQAALETAQGN